MGDVQSAGEHKGRLSSRWFQAFLFVVSVLFGLLIKPVLGQFASPLADTVCKAIIAELVIVALVGLVGIYAAIALYSERYRRDQLLNRDINAISTSIGLRALFLHEGNREPGQDAYSIVRQLVDEAQEELLILDHRPSMTPNRFYDETPPNSEGRTKYYEELTRKALSKTADGRYFRYKRVVQIDEGPTEVWNTAINKDTFFAEHCRHIVEFRHTTPKAVCSVKTSRVFYPKSSIIIVDGKKVLIEMAIIGPEGKSRVEGDLIFFDPEGQLAAPLKDLFDHINGQSTLITRVE